MASTSEEMPRSSFPGPDRAAMSPRIIFPIAALVGGMSACADLPARNSVITAGGSASYTSEYWFRGTPVNLGGAFQGDVSLSVPTSGGGSLGFTTWANIDGSNETGAAFYPDNNGSQVTEVDYVIQYSHSIGAVDTSLGLVNYNFPNVQSRSTSEVFATASTGVLGFDQGFSLYYDVDAARDLYVSFDIGKSFNLSDRLSLSVSAIAGHMGDDQAAFYFGAQEGGISDIAASVSLDYVLDDVTSLFGSINAARTVDSALEESLEASGYDTDGVWFTLGAAWSL